MGRVDRIHIQLERGSGVFYAGEVVRGHVTFVVSGNVACRGLQLHLTGQARVHWHTGSGEDRNDYDGKTVFQNQRVTLHGSYFKTGLLDEAGEDAQFGRTHGDGTVYIPCDHGEADTMLLAVRVMDYDFGKKDDLLGEVLIDAADVARSGQVQSFPLSRNGKPEKGQVVLSAKFLPFESLFPIQGRSGVRASASAIRSQCLVLKVHSATGLRKADWVGKNDVYCQIYRPTGDITQGKKLPGPNKSVQLPKGETTYPFAFQLASDSPGSAEIPAGDRAHVRYDLYAHAVFARWRDPCSRRTIAVIPNRPVPTLALLSPTQQATPPSPVYNCSCCCMKCCRERGSVSVTLSTDRRSYAPGEEINLSGSVVVNETRKDLTISVVLRQYIMLKTSRGSSHRTRCDFCILQLPCPAGQTCELKSQAEKAIVPSVFPSFEGGVKGTVSRTFYPSLMWTYTLEIRAGTGGTCSSTVDARIPLLIAAAPPYPDAIAKARGTSPAMISDDPWLIFKDAVTGPEACETTPRVSGVEDGGQVVSAHNMGVVSTTDYQEDKGLIGTSPMYQPVVNTFTQQVPDPTASPSSAAPLEMDPSLINQNTTASSPSTETNLAHVSTGALLSSVEVAYDKRQAVGVWVRNHPDQAAHLTPDDVAAVLSKVTFSFEQAAVANELAAGFEQSGSLTCDHIIAAMMVCKYQMADVAKAMAPYANDPQNKESVLNELQFSFERDDVAKCFRQ